MANGDGGYAAELIGYVEIASQGDGRRGDHLVGPGRG
jgi:hypothetical protein